MARRATRCCCCMAAGRRAMPGGAPPSNWRARARWPTRSISAATATANGSRTALTRLRISPPMRPRSRRVAQRRRQAPIVIGASLGGMASLLAEGKAERAGRGRSSPRSCWSTSRRASIASGVAKIQGFMRERAAEGFADVAEAADAVAAYLPHRAAPALARRAEEEPAPASRRPLALALGPAHAARASARSRSIIAILEAALIEAAQGDHHSGAAGARRLVRTGAGGACARIPRTRAARRLHRRRRRPPHGGGRLATTVSRPRCCDFVGKLERETPEASSGAGVGCDPIIYCDASPALEGLKLRPHLW